LLSYVGRQHNLRFDQDQMARFGLISSFGVPLEAMGDFLALEKQERKQYEQIGIPIDSNVNELKYWLVGARIANPQLRFAINGDAKAPVKRVREVFAILQDMNITRFNLITDAKKDVS